MNYNKIAEENYKYFSKADGNQHIASEYGLKIILRLIEDFSVTSILELGLGIGSIADTALKFAAHGGKKMYYAGTESNAFCLNALKNNVQQYNEVHLYDQLSDVPKDRKYDLIIVDGSDEALQNIAAFASANTLIFVEGWRGSQVAVIKSIFPNSLHSEVISDYRNPVGGPFPSDRWSGGGQLIFVNPTLYQKCYWFKERVSTNLKYKIRKFK